MIRGLGTRTVTFYGRADATLTTAEMLAKLRSRREAIEFWARRRFWGHWHVGRFAELKRWRHLL